MIELVTIKIGSWTASPALNLLECGDRSVRIEPRAMDVLAYLAARSGAVVSVEELMASVWKGVVVGDGSVYLAIRQLRQVLDDPDRGAHHIETIPKRGYRLTVPVERVEGAPLSPSVPVATAEVSHARRSISRRGWIVLASIAVAVIAGALVVLRFTPARDAGNSVAVLPFENLSSDREQEYFADGVTEEILNTLSGVRDLRVIGRTSSFHFKDRKADLAAIGEALGVEHILNGSVRKAGDQVRVSAQLLNVASGQQLWSRTYERRLDDVFAIQDEIATSVANALQIRLGIGEVGRVPGMTRDVAAYDEYLRSLPLNLAGSYPEAISHLQRAVAIDPSFSLAWSGLNGVYTNAALSMQPEQAREWRSRGALALLQARALTPDAPHVLLQIAIGEARGCNWLAAAPLYEGLQPAYAKYGMANQAWAPRGIFLMFVGRTREAIPVLERARAEDPLAPALAGFLAQAYLANENFTGALAEVDRGSKRDGVRLRASQRAFMISLNRNDRPDMDRRLSAMLEASRLEARPSAIYSIFRFLDSPPEALGEIRRIAAMNKPNERTVLATLAAYFHAPELAIELLSKDPTNGEIAPFLWQPVMRDARKLPAFNVLVRKMGLLDYWRAYGWPDHCRATGAEGFACS